MTGPPRLQGIGITKVFGEGPTAFTCLHGVDLELGAGEVVVLLGPSGSGKTTLLSILAGLLQPTSGRVLLDGGSAGTDRLHDFGFAFQTFNLMPALTALENVALPLRLAGVRRREALGRGARSLHQVGLDGRADARPRTLSGGEQQRVSLARALVAEPKVIFADEPTASLDTRSGEEVTALLVALAREQGRSCLIVTHDERIGAAADRVLRIEDGRLTG